MSTIMSTQSAEQLLQDMMTQYCKPWLFVYPNMKKLSEVLTLLFDQQKLHILQQHYSGVRTPLHTAARWGHTEIIRLLLTSLQSSAHRLKLLMVDEYTPLHTAALIGRRESVKMILECLTADQQIQIMSVQRSGGETAIQWAKINRNTDTVRILTEYRHRAEQIQLQLQQQKEEKRRLYQSLSGKMM